MAAEKLYRLERRTGCELLSSLALAIALALALALALARALALALALAFAAASARCAANVRPSALEPSHGVGGAIM